MKLLSVAMLAILLPLSSMASEGYFKRKCAQEAADAVRAKGFYGTMTIDSSTVIHNRGVTYYIVSGWLSDPQTFRETMFWYQVDIDNRTCKNAKVN